MGSTFNGTANAWQAGDYESVSGSVSVVGTNGATFYITGVQLEKGVSATGYEYRQYGQELQLCQRYFQTTYNTGISPGTASTLGTVTRTLDATQLYPVLCWNLPTKMRATPTSTYYSPASGASGKISYNPGSVDVTASNNNTDGMQNVSVILNGISISQSYGLFAHFTCSAEL
jgi:hypothetical protein